MALALSITALPSLTAYTAMTSTAIAASGGTAPYNISVTDGALPVGVAFDGANFTGTPTVPGDYYFAVTAIDATGNTVAQIFQGTVAPDTTDGQFGVNTSTRNLVTATVAAGKQFTKVMNGFTYTYVAGDTVQISSYMYAQLKSDGVMV